MINSLIVPHFVFRFQCLSSPSKYVHMQYRNLITQFLWNNAKLKISFDNLVNDKIQGGINLCNINLKNISLKITLLHRILGKEPGDFAMKAILDTINIPREIIMNISLSPRDINQIVDNNFARDLMLSVCTLTYKMPRNKPELFGTCPWFNSQIKAGNKTLFHPRLYQRGIHKFEQFHDN